MAAYRSINTVLHSAYLYYHPTLSLSYHPLLSLSPSLLRSPSLPKHLPVYPIYQPASRVALQVVNKFSIPCLPYFIPPIQYLPRARTYTYVHYLPPSLPASLATCAKYSPVSLNQLPNHIVK